MYLWSASYLRLAPPTFCHAAYRRIPSLLSVGIVGVGLRGRGDRGRGIVHQKEASDRQLLRRSVMGLLSEPMVSRAWTVVCGVPLQKYMASASQVSCRSIIPPCHRNGRASCRASWTGLPATLAERPAEATGTVLRAPTVGRWTLRRAPPDSRSCPSTAPSGASTACAAEEGPYADGLLRGSSWWVEGSLAWRRLRALHERGLPVEVVERWAKGQPAGHLELAVRAAGRVR